MKLAKLRERNLVEDGEIRPCEVPEGERFRLLNVLGVGMHGRRSANGDRKGSPEADKARRSSGARGERMGGNAQSHYRLTQL